MPPNHNPQPQPVPPRWARWLLTRLHPDDTLEEVEGDLDELYAHDYARVGKTRATLRYLLNVVSVLPPFVRRRQRKQDYYQSPSTFSPNMLRNYIKIAWRNLVNQTTYSLINIAGLAVGMAVALLIGLWIYDELSFDKSFANYDRIARVVEQKTSNGTTFTTSAIPIPIREALKTEYSSDFSHLALSSWTLEYILANGDNKYTKQGNYVEPEFTRMLPLTMLKGSQDGLADPASIMLAKSAAETLFGDTDPIGKIVKVNNKQNVKVTGVYEDFGYNTEFRLVKFLLSWQQYLVDQPWVKRSESNWGNNSFQLFVAVAPNTTVEQVSAKIAGIKSRHAKDEARFNPIELLHPMSRWHLHTDWDNSVLMRGRMQFVWLFGAIGVFVLLLACINFMNLNTARSEKRAKEVGVRKAVGSLRRQLMGQFLTESWLVALIALVVSLLLVRLALPWFNEVADKDTTIPWGDPVFWAICLGISLLTGFLAGSYPAFYLSSFQPVKVLKGTFRVGRFASVPRKVLVVMQFTVSVTLIIGTIVVFRQIQHAKNRPIGYDRAGLLTVLMNTPDFYGHYDALRADLIRTGAAQNMAESSSPTTDLWATDASFSWRGKAPDVVGDFGTVAVTHDYGKTVGWQFKQGRDFSRAFSTDSLGIIVNEKAVKFMGFKKPIGEFVQWNGKTYTIVGVIRDVVMSSPFEPVVPTVFLMDYNWANLITVKLNPQLSAREALARIEPVFKKYNPGSPFEYTFASEAYDQKFRTEERVGKLATLFALLAIFVSCLGLFGLASFMAEQRTKEIGIRKILGASVLHLWQLLSKEFVVLVFISLLIASPLAYYFMNDWLQQYQYRSDIAWWIFALTGAGALSIALLTVSFQSIKAALMNPVKSLRSE